MPRADAAPRSGPRPRDGEQQAEPAEHRGTPDRVLVDVRRPGGHRDAAVGGLAGDRRRRWRPAPCAARSTRPGGPAGRGSRRPRTRPRPGCSASPTRRRSRLLLLVPVAASSPCRSATTSASTPETSPPPDRSRAATSTSVPSSVTLRARTQIRRGRMNSDPSSPISASTTPPSATNLPGVWLIWILFHALDLRRRSPSRARRAARRSAPAAGRPGTASRRPSSPLGVGLVERVDRLRGAVVHPEVAGVDEHRDRRVPVVARTRDRLVRR